MTATGAMWRNWARTEAVRPVRVERPATTEAVQRAVRAAATSGLRIKPVGAGHSFTGIAVAPGVQLDLTDLSGLIEADVATGRVTLAAGTRLHQLPALLAPYGLALPNMGDIDRQTIAGATSTGTHGTGLGFGGLATQIVAAKLVTGAGELLTVSETERPELLPAVRVGLGALGVLVEVTLQLVPRFVLHAVEEPEPLDSVLDGWLHRVRHADHFEFYWFPHTATALTKTNTRLPGDADRTPLSRVLAMARRRVARQRRLPGDLRRGPDGARPHAGAGPTGRRRHEDHRRPRVLRLLPGRLHLAPRRALP